VATIAAVCHLFFTGTARLVIELSPAHALFVCAMKKLSWLDTAALAALPVMAVLATSSPGRTVSAVDLLNHSQQPSQAHSCTRSAGAAELSIENNKAAKAHVR
jgi:hypothetical protein